MKIQQKSRRLNIRIITAIAIVALLIIAACIFAYSKHIGPFYSAPASQINLKPATSAQKHAGEQQKKQTAIPNQDTKQDLPPTTDANNKALAVTITALNQNGNTVQIRSLIQAVLNEGTCTVTLTKNDGVTVTKTSSIQHLSSSSTCEGFDIPTSELSSGTWSVALTVNSNDISGGATGKITVQ